MSPDNFCYWLQGAFELTGLQVLTAEQVACVMAHSDLVLEHCKSHRLPLPAVIIEIRTLLRIIDTESAARLTFEIKRVLGEQFQHVIDPKAGPADVQAKLNEIHGSYSPAAVDAALAQVFRC